MIDSNENLPRLVADPAGTKCVNMHCVLALLAYIAGALLCNAQLVEHTASATDWETNIYSKIGLKIQVPPARPDVEDQNKRWSLLAYQMVAKPVSDTQYRLLINVSKQSIQQYSRNHPPGGTSSDWINEQHKELSFMTNAMWIYARRDLATNAIVYVCTGRIKRIPASNMTQSEDLRIVEVTRRVIDSIEVISQK